MFDQTKIVEVEYGTEIECPETRRKLVVTDEHALELSGSLFVTSAHAAAFRLMAEGRKSTSSSQVHSPLAS